MFAPFCNYLSFVQSNRLNLIMMNIWHFIGKGIVQTIPILMYHSVSTISSTDFRRYAVSPDAFKEQMQYLKTNGYTALTVSKYVDALQSGNSGLPNNPVVITFDDGFEDFYTTVYPILKYYQMPATLYLSTAYIGGTSEWLRMEGEGQRRILSWEQITSFDAALVEIGGHSHTHPKMDSLQSEEIKHEMVWCKQEIENNLGRECRSFAYPFGFYNSECQRQLRAAGYQSACAVRYQQSIMGEDRFALSRLIVPSDATLNEFRALLSGIGQSNSQYVRLRSKVWRWLRKLRFSTIR